MVILLLIHLLIERNLKMKEDSLVVTEYMKDLFLWVNTTIQYIMGYRVDIVFSNSLEMYVVLWVN